MKSYQYEAITLEGKRLKGVMQALSPKELRQALRERALIPLTLKPVSEKQAKHSSWFNRSISHKEITLMTRQLSTLIEAEIPLSEALSGVAEQTDQGPLKQVLLDLKTKVSEGYALSVALRQHGSLFSDLYTASVAAGESSGDLAVILNSLADYMEDQQRIRSKVSQALIYPSFVMIISFVFTAILLVTVVPQMLEVFADQQQALPLVTKVLLFISHAVALLGIPLIILLIGLAIAFKQASKKIAFKTRWQAACLRIPFIGRLIITVQTARFMRTTALLSQAGVPLLDAMGAGGEVVSMIPIASSLVLAKQHVREGVSFHQALSQTHYFSAMSLHMLASGERAGKLESMMQRAAKQQETEVEEVISRALSLFEPIMILVMGCVVLFIVLAVLLPVFSATQLF